MYKTTTSTGESFGIQVLEYHHGCDVVVRTRPQTTQQTGQERDIDVTAELYGRDKGGRRTPTGQLNYHFLELK